MKILFTGMASSHCSPTENVSFFNLIAKAAGHSAEVVWDTPKLSWTKADLESFDLVFFGFIPPTALSANKIYGAMHLLGLMFDSPKLRLVVDGQQIWQYKNSIEMVKRDVSSLFSPFYSKRAEYSIARDPLQRGKIELAASYFSSSRWPTTYYPALPWNNHSRAIDSLGFGNAESFIGINLDSLIVNPEPFSTHSKKDFWSVDNHKSPWAKKLELSLSRPIVPLKSSRLLADVDAASTIRNSLGAIITPQDRKVGTWWTYRYIQALNSNTPIVTDWVDTVGFSDCWSKLAYQIEDMTESDRAAAARDQLDSYQAHIKNKKETLHSFMQDILELDSERI